MDWSGCGFEKSIHATLCRYPNVVLNDHEEQAFAYEGEDGKFTKQITESIVGLCG